MNVFTLPNIVLCITILLLIETCPLSVITLYFGVDVYIPNSFVLLLKVRTY